VNAIHPALPGSIASTVLAIIAALSVWTLLAPPPDTSRSTIFFSLARLPGLGAAINRAVSTPWVLLPLKFLVVGLFLLVIAAGLLGSPIAGRNIATVLTWTIWWSGLVISIFFVGSAWCAICPWDTLAQWLVRRRLWRRAVPNNSLDLRLPRALQNVWPALGMFVALSWLELGVGITLDPYATALVALLMVVMATLSMALLRRKTFCRNICPVGRTIGFYSQLSAIELRPIEPDICAKCETLDCYHGNADVEPCPTSLVMGRLRQNSYCTSCGNCTRSCPEQNITWRLREPGTEAVHGARPHWDEAWFMLTLLAMTGFHGLMMLPLWTGWIGNIAHLIGDSGTMLVTFSLGLVTVCLTVVSVYTVLVVATQRLMQVNVDFHRVFASFAFVALPLAFAYHIAHNLNHLLGESASLFSVFANPFGVNSVPMSIAEMTARPALISAQTLWILQAGLLVAGFIVSVRVIRLRGIVILATAGKSTERYAIWRLSPILLFAIGMTLFHLWLLMQPMMMRM